MLIHVSHATQLVKLVLVELIQIANHVQELDFYGQMDNAEQIARLVIGKMQMFVNNVVF